MPAPVHVLDFVKSTPIMRLELSRPHSRSPRWTCSSVWKRSRMATKWFCGVAAAVLEQHPMVYLAWIPGST